nr:MAG TPA: hypothetical protein [Caudoviricetes sp.]
MLLLRKRRKQTSVLARRSAERGTQLKGGAPPL